MAVPFKRGVMTPERRKDSPPFRHCMPKNEDHEDYPDQILDKKECRRPSRAFPSPKENQDHNSQQEKRDRQRDYGVFWKGVGTILEILDYIVFHRKGQWMRTATGGSETESVRDEAVAAFAVAVLAGTVAEHADLPLDQVYIEDVEQVLRPRVWDPDYPFIGICVTTELVCRDNMIDAIIVVVCICVNMAGKNTDDIWLVG